MTYLVITKVSDDGRYTATVPRLPECTATGATMEEVSANIKKAIEAHLLATGANNGAVELYVSENVWKERKRGDGLDDVMNQAAREFDELTLEQFIDFDPSNLEGCISSEEMMRQLEELA